MSEDSPFYTHRDSLAFRHFAANQLKRPVVDLGDGASITNILDLALASTRDIFTHAFANNRPDGDPFRVYPAYLSSTSPDAYAAEQFGVHLCGIHIGLAASFYEFSLFCFCQKTLFPSFGSPGLETSPECIDGFPPGFWLHQAGDSMDLSEVLARAAPLIPKDDQRHYAAMFLTVLMLRYVWLHELCHCLNGHVGLVKDRKWSLYLHEHGMEESRGVAKRQIQCLELDADQSALYMLCKVQSESLENVDGLRELPMEARLGLSLFAAYATTWIIDEYARSAKAPSDTDHPDPYLRLHNLIRTLASNVVLEIPETERSHDACLEEIERLTRIIPTFPEAERIVEDMRRMEFQSSLDKYQDDLTILRQDLNAFRYSR